VEEYRKVLANYPKCDLASDADWMVRNILSGGALMPKFDDSAFVADSTARADSLKKAGIKDGSKAKPSKAPSADATASKSKSVAAKIDADANKAAVKPTPAASGAK